MDLRFREARPTAAERRAVDAVLGPPSSGWEGGRRRAESDGRAASAGHDARARRHLLLPALHAAQGRVGWISEGALNYICQRLTLPPAEAYGVASFYGMLSLERRAPAVAHVCDDLVCRLNGAEALCGRMEHALGPEGGRGRAGATWVRSPCLGLCEQAPAALVSRAGAPPVETAVGGATAEGLVAALRSEVQPAPAKARLPQHGEPGLRLLRRVGRVDPESLDDYRARDGYRALRVALDLGPEGVIREVTDSRLFGRGGAAFPTGRKWDAVAKAPVRTHYLVCNADESEPGTFKDRVLLEEDPFAIVEAMTIAAYATGCEKGFLYVRGEYPLAAQRLSRAVAAARSRGYLGDDVMGHGFRFDIEVRRGAGAYICGEETALFNSIEGYRGEPRNKPPFPTVAGLFGKPTVVNNVETLANVLEVMLAGGPAYAGNGTARSTGTKLFCVTGHVGRPGLYEVPFGVSMADLLARAGGLREGRSLKAVLLGGAAGTFLTPDETRVPLTFEDTWAIGASLGSGVVLALDESADLMDLSLRIAAFFRHESCGQCVPCRVGTVRQEEALRRIARGRLLGTPKDEARLLADLGQAMRDASICGLGHTASSAVASAVAKLGLLDGGRP
ncbi:MAG TPA: NAD(P)H-dependent oxidoreductase subunit E [Vicinamibacteria bacterium]|nr:NAD(P)H-dependent oxidoreductase subunit E [Vicinamibacteria bacterium]